MSKILGRNMWIEKMVGWSVEFYLLTDKFYLNLD